MRAILTKKEIHVDMELQREKYKKRSLWRAHFLTICHMEFVSNTKLNDESYIYV